MIERTPPDPRMLWAITVGIGVLAALLGALFDYNVPTRGTDFNWSVQAARDLIAGRDPYARPSGPNAIPYPLPAALIGLPFAPLRDIVASALFAGVASAVMAYALARTGEWWRLLVFLSPCYLMALKHIQWSPLFFAAVLLPAFAPVIAVKPTLGLVTAAATRWHRWSLLALLLLVAAAFVLQPDWPWRWYPQTRSYYGFVPLLTFPGWILFLAARHWREWRGRLLLVFAIVPQHIFFYDQLLLYHIPRNRRELQVLLATGWLALGLALSMWELRTASLLIVAGLYLPALVILWRRRRGDTPEHAGPTAGATAKGPEAEASGTP